MFGKIKVTYDSAKNMTKKRLDKSGIYIYDGLGGVNIWRIKLQIKNLMALLI
jgi:hypothetical protein